ncbi:MAG: hypothetical protein ACYC8T_34660, partial [Myxococcaceae bacterium]
VVHAGESVGSRILSGAAAVVNGAATAAGNVVNGAVNVAGNVVNGAVNAAGNVVNGAVNLAGNAARGAVDLARLIATDPGAASPLPIDRTNMTAADKAVVNVLGLDSMLPGQKVEAEVTASAELAAVLGVEVGAKVSVSVERDATDPNKFKISLGGEGEVGGKLTGDTAGAEANGTAALTGSAGIELTVDLSQPGGASELAAFAAQTGAMSAMASLPMVGPAMVGAVNLLEQLPGVNLPGEPIDFIRDHLTAIEVGVGGKLGGILGGALGPGVQGTLDLYLKGGGRVDFNPDGTLTLTESVAAGVTGTARGGVGVAGATAMVDLASGTAEVGFERSLVVNPGPPPQALSEGYSATLTLGGDVAGPAGLTVGGEVKLKVAIDQLPPMTQEKVQAALLAGDTQAAAQLIADAVNGGQVKASIDVTQTTALGGEVKVKPEEAGVGGGITLGGSVSSEIPVISGSVTVTATGVKLDAALFGFPAGTELTWDQLRELSAGVGPQLAN